MINVYVVDFVGALAEQIKCSLCSICWILKHKQGLFCCNAVKEGKPIWLSLLDIVFSRFA